MSAGYRFVGGSQHGTFRALPRDDRYVVFPQYNRERNIVATASTAYEPIFTEEVYERRPIAFDGFATVYVMAKKGMGQAEFMRRVADIVEGV